MIGVNAETSTGMGAIGRMQVVVRYERVSHLYRCTPERQSLCESHRQRRWLTCWSYVAGATPLNRNTARYSDDIDVFHDCEERVAAAALHDVDVLEAAGHRVTWLRQLPLLYTAEITHSDTSTRLEWLHKT